MLSTSAPAWTTPPHLHDLPMCRYCLTTVQPLCMHTKQYCKQKVLSTKKGVGDLDRNGYHPQDIEVSLDNDNSDQPSCHEPRPSTPQIPASQSGTSQAAQATSHTRVSPTQHWPGIQTLPSLVTQPPLNRSQHMLRPPKHGLLLPCHPAIHAKIQDICNHDIIQLSSKVTKDHAPCVEFNQTVPISVSLSMDNKDRKHSSVSSFLAQTPIMTVQELSVLTSFDTSTKGRLLEELSTPPHPTEWSCFFNYTPPYNVPTMASHPRLQPITAQSSQRCTCSQQ